MKNKQELVIELLHEHLVDAKIGIIIKGVDDVLPEEIIKSLAAEKSHLYAATVGYEEVKEHSEEQYDITDSIEKAVLWRSIPQCAGSIIVFVRNDTDKLHSLAEFEVITTRDVARFLVAQQINKENNTPTNSFWIALQSTSDFYTFDALHEFVTAVTESSNPAEAIPQNMWRLNLLQDTEILGTKSKPEERLAKNRDLIFAIGQLSEDSRKKLSRSLVRTKAKDKDRLQKAYNSLQKLYKYGNRETLKALDLETVQELFSASQKSDKKKKKEEPTTPGETPETPEDIDTTPIRPKELDRLISDAVVFGDEEDQENIRDLLNELNKHYDTESEENDDSIPTIGGIFGDRNIVLENHQTDLRKLVGKFCSTTAWGGIMETDETVLKDAISADINSIRIFDPDDKESVVAFAGGIDGSQPLFDFITQFDAQFDSKGIETAERFSPIIANLKEKRAKLYSCLDLIMYHPVLLFGASETDRSNLIEYIRAWEQLYHAFCVNEPTMRQISAGGTSFIARAILLLDVLYVKTPKEWKGILLPLHPVYLWRYYEVFRTLPSKKATLSEEDKTALSNVFSQLPQVLSFIVANNIVTETTEDRVLPCSGSVEMLPTFENKTNRYLGNDGTESVEEILTRWVGFAPYTKNEIRVCSVDAPDLIGNIRQIKGFMDKNEVKRVVYDVYLTRNQNGNTELSKLDYSGKDYEIGEYIRNDKISISIRNVRTSADVKSALDFRPVHVAFYFDQSSYAIEYGPNSHNLYINPLVITYDYDFDEIQHKGSIYPSSEMDSGLIGDYHKLMRSADIISNNMNPRTTYNGNADMTAVVSTIKDRQTQWLVVADRDTNNYQPEAAIPIGEMQYDKRMVNAWAADDSRIITQYLTLLRGYNLYPRTDTLIDILRQFGHIASNGLISIPKFGADAQAVDNKKKGLIGTLFAASWYMKQHDDALVASLDDDKARLWLHNSKFGNERADLVGLYYDEGVIIQQVPNSDELLLDVPRLKREKVLFKDVISSLPEVTSPEQLYFPLGRTPNGKDLFEDLGQMPHMLVGGSTGSGKSVFLFSMLAAMLMTHPRKEDLQLILSSAKLEDFIHLEGLPHLYSGSIISDADEATRVIKEVVFEESERRGKLLADARVANIIEYNKTATEKLAPIVVVIDEFADLADQLETKKEQNAFYKPVQRIAQAGRSRGIHLVICTQRPEAKLVPSTTKAQLNGRVALRVNDGISSRMIIEEPDAQYLQKHGDMIYRNGDVIERAQGYLIEIPELDQIVKDVIDGKYVK